LVIGIVLKKLKILKINKKFFSCCFLLLGLNLGAQKDAVLSKDWIEKKQAVDYKRESKYKGPADWSSSGPNMIHSNPESFINPKEENKLDEIIERNRSNEARKGGSEKVMKKPKEIKIPEFDPPDINEPDFDIDIDAPNPLKVSKSTWRAILFILIFSIVLVLLYFWLKRMNFNSKVTQEFDENWNPEVITKSELESRLDHALSQEIYREAIRIYYTIILQELIRLKMIRWKLEKTNHQYIYEVKNVNHKADLSNCTRFFDIVWYGEYTIDLTKFEELQPRFTRFIQTLKSIKDE